jgi:hypothetical protein
MTRKATQKANTTAPLMPDHKTTYLSRMDSVAYVRENCGNQLPFIGWGIGRRDSYATWREQVDMINALKECRFGFAFNWNNGGHSEGPAAAGVIMRHYQTRFARNRSYPAFTNSSLDARIGNGEPSDGDPDGCINCGFEWTDVEDEAGLWSAAISNSMSASPLTVDITPRNVQRFHPERGTGAVAWSTSTGQRGVVQTDAHGLVTAPSVVLSPGRATAIRFTTAGQSAPAKPPIKR